MASLTLADFQSEVQLACRNMPTTDPYYGAGGVIITRFINRARQKIIRMMMGPETKDLFPELHSSWTIGPTYPTGSPANEIPRPADAIAVIEVWAAHSATAPDWSATKEYPVTYLSQTAFASLSKDSNTTGYATKFTRRGKVILIHPTPSSAYPDYLHFKGTMRDNILVAPGDTFFADERWDDATVLLAAAKIQKRRGWITQSQGLMEDFKAELEEANPATALEDLSRDDAITVTGQPTRATVYPA